MNIAILCHSSAGGSGVLATELALGLSQLGHEIHVIGDRRPFRWEEADKESIYRDLGDAPPKQTFWGQVFDSIRRSFGTRFIPQTGNSGAKPSLHFHELLSFDYPLFDKASFPTLRAANTLAKLIQEQKIDLVNAHYVIPHATSAILARDSGLDCRVVTTLHGTDITRVGLDPAFFFTTQHAIRSSDGTTAVCKYLAAEAKSSFSIQSQISVIPNWVDSRRFIRIEDPKQRAKFAQPEEQLCVHVSNFRPVKRSTDVIRAFAKLLEKVPARLLLIGEGPQKKDCLDLAIELGISGRIVSMAPSAAVENLLGIADILFLPSEIEAFPLVLLEGMAAGAICLSTNVGGVSELITDGEHGFLFPVGAHEAMASTAERLYLDGVLRERIRSNSRRRVQEEYSPERLIQQYVQYFQGILSSSPS